jgi:hypothetical protein
MTNEAIEAVKGIGKGVATTTPGISQDMEPNKDRFDSMMAKESSERSIVPLTPPPAVEAVSKPSPMDELRKLNAKVDAISKASPAEISGQAQQLIAEIDLINKKFAPHAQSPITPSYNALLKNRLSHIDDTLKIALSKAGLEYTAPVQPTGTGNPIEKFLGYLTHGQYQLEHLGSAIAQVQGKGMEVTPADMLAIQVKVNQIQQELEFFTNVLNKALESTKTLMNVQV